ncbi:tRNA (adenosine(37)-N6)-threonylcarbamoyltransferase complex dimerization subunit type 1 TsaB [Blautia sp. MSJ-9]|uniref:tRNA (adenosine(37)-N6)-threonylcarbamoyltransferase complex dimerization subunit type 1 TsaB n=2 Tax=Blautia TaxID=572511 RepID=UPI001C12619B|nr:tRNA (adenosine(37)-N6)-threonylcarbamoyltransferase complex dimerization subunit type 1 TsaB [Blautia sp. MSJ-9]MBU5681747.1 tRNA (adenosine(37)-N6)-threonylcarbamoyltransferase complex dimerization subunit type 1 TsaB [Blautia sp. MSJ-9]
MKILALDSSGIVASVAVVEDDTLLAEYTVNYKKTHSQTLLPMLDEIVKMTELDLESIDAIAVAAGPGSFTGLRIGSATAKGLGLALKKPLVAVPTVDALAYNLYDAQGVICPIMDARRKQVYTGIYRFEEHQFVTLKEQWAAPIEELLEELNHRGEMVTFLGDGVPVFRDLIAEKLQVPYSFAPAHVNKQRAAAVAALGSIYYKEGRTETAMEHVPEYLRVSQAERERAERESTETGGCRDMILREMLVDDLDQVMEIEQDLFHVPWTKEGFFTFLTRDDAMFLVVEEKEKILGYCGLLMVLDEGDITNVAVRRDRQREGIGAFLMQSLIRLATEQDVTTIHLEVRVGNETAIRLYERMGFTRDGIRKAYYSDPVEDALLMTRHPQ